MRWLFILYHIFGNSPFDSSTKPFGSPERQRCCHEAAGHFSDFTLLSTPGERIAPKSLRHEQHSGWVVDLPLWKIWKSVGMTIPNIWKKKHVPNHQPVLYWLVGIPRSCILIIPNIWRVVYSPNSSSTSVLNTAHFCDSLGRDRRCLEKKLLGQFETRNALIFHSNHRSGSGCVISIPTSDESMNINQSYPNTIMVGRWLTILKNMKVNGKDYLI